MAQRNINNNTLKTALINGDAFEYAHLVKFERPFVPFKGQHRTDSTRYVYLTDGQRDITFDGNTYRASGLLTVGAYSETVQARATNMSLTLPGEFLGTEITCTASGATYSGSRFSITVTNQLANTLDEDFDFFEQGLRVGEKVRIEKSNGTNFTDGVKEKDFIVDSFVDHESGSNNRLILSRTGTDSDDSDYSTFSSTLIKITLLNEEYKGATMEKGTTEEVASTADNTATITLSSSNNKIQVGQLVSGKGVIDETVVKSINGTTLLLSKTQPRVSAGTILSFTNPSFVNREVFIYKAYINPETGATYGNPVLVFKGITASTNIQESPNSSKVQWNLTSHWGDFQEVRGRITKDEIHRALDTNGEPNKDLTIRPEYSSDLGFLHSETSLNTIAVYQTTETRTRLKKKKRGGLAGLFGGIKYYEEEYQVQVDNEVDLSVYLQGSYLPVVYGVQRINGIPVFADTKSNNSKEVYVVYSLAEGQIHGIYNMYIDGAPLICIDKADFDVRNSSTGTDKDNTQLQCYGRADQGATLSGVNVTSSTSNTYIDDYDDIDYHDYGQTRNYSNYGNLNRNNVRRYQSLNESNISQLTTTDAAEGLRHRETASISHPYSMHFTFYQGRPNQKGDNNLTTIAQANQFKRQTDYYSGEKSYWSPEHRLLDTAYAVMKFTIDADQTTIPDVEYVVKGKVLECFNYDGTYVPDPVYSSSNIHTNFNEGDSVTVEVSSDGVSYSSDGNGTYRILDKYQFTPAEGSSYYRFRLDKMPVVGNNYYLRLKSGSNYWYMLTYNHQIISSASFPESDNQITTSFTTNSSGQLKATLSTAEKTKLQQFYPNITNSALTSEAYLKFKGGTGIFAGLRNIFARAILSSNDINILGTNYSANQTSTSGQPLNGATAFPATKFDLSDNSTLDDLTATNRMVGSRMEIIETGEKRKIISFDAANTIVEIDEAFITTPTSDNTYKIYGKGADLRSSINPAIQLCDMLTNERFGKGLDIDNDIDVSSIKESALLCDTRADVTIPLASAATCVAGDVYKLVDPNNSNAHIASGKVLNSTSSSSSVIFTDVSGKFVRNYFNYISYNVGDIVVNSDTTSTRYYRVTSAGFKSTPPTHVSGTTDGFEYISSLSLTKVSGTGPSSLSLAVDGRTLEYSLYDSDFVKYWRYLGWEENRQYAVTRHQTNFIFATERPIFENINALLSHFNGILSYSAGKYVLSVETQETAPVSTITDGIEQNPEVITNDDIIGTISLNDNSQRNSKNTIKASINDPQNNFSSRAVSFFNSDFLKADRGKVKTGSFPITGITSYYNARIGVEKELIQSRYSKEISFTIGPKGLLLKPGEVIGITYQPFGFDNKLFRIENLTYNSNCTTAIKAREYDDSIYAITAQNANSAQRAATGGNYALSAPSAPTNLTTGSAKPGIITLNWTNSTDYKETIDSTEIWRATSQGSSGEITAHATLLTVVDNARTYQDAVGVAGTYYYWIRHRRISRRTADNSTVKLVGAFESNIDAGVSGVANVLSPQLDVDISSFQVKFNASNVLTPGGTNQDVKFTATLRNITANNVTFTLVDADGSTTATDGVVFTNNNTSVVDTTAPYEATIDASSFSHNTENKFIKVTTTDSGTSETFTELVPITVTKDGSSGSIGQDAIAIKLTPSSHVVPYTATGGENTTISFTTSTQGVSSFTGTTYYRFIVEGVTKQTSTTSTFTLADSDEPANASTKVVTVQLYDGDPSASGTLEATDSVTIFGIKDGSDSITAFLTNNSHTVSANPDGTLESGALNDAGGTFKIFVGTTDKTTNCTFAEVSGEETSGLTSNINSTTGVYEVTGLTVDNAVNIFRATIPANQSPTGQEVTLDQTYSISKSRTGTAGSAGANAKTVDLTSSGYAIVYDSNGSNPSPSGTLTLTATAKNFTDPYFKFTGDGLSDESGYTDGSGTTDTFSYSVPSSFFSTPKLIRVGVSEADESNTEIAFDSINISAVKDGVTGEDAITAIVTNEAHTFPANSAGTISSFAGSGTDIQVFKGSTELNGIVSGTPTTGQFKVTATASNISTGNISSSGNPVVVADHSNMTADSASISYAINVENTITLTKKQSFSKSKAGATGTDSLSGFLTNESTSAQTFTGFNLFTYSNSIIDYTGTNGEFKVFEGTTEKSSGITFGISGGTAGATNTTKTQNSLTLTINNTTGAYSFSGANWSTTAETFTLTATIGSATIEKIVSIDKTAFLTATRLTASEQAFKYDGGSANPSPSSITLTASAPNSYAFLGTYQYKFSKSTDGGSTFTQVQGYSTTNTYTVSAGNFSLGNEIYKVEVRNSYNTSVVLDEDEITLIRIKEGQDGRSNAEVKIYQRTTNPNSAPAVPNNNLTYNFTTGAFTVASGNAALDGWSLDMSYDTTGAYLWSCTAQAVGAVGATTDIIAPGDWATPVRQVIEEPRVRTDSLYYTGWSAGNAQELSSTQLDTLKYDFSARNFASSTIPSGWSNSRPSWSGTTYTYAVLRITESSYEGDSETAGNQTIEAIRYGVKGKYVDRDPDDFEFDFDTTNNRFRGRVGNDLSYKTSDIPVNYRNDQIDIDFDGDNPRITRFSGSTVTGSTPNTLKNSSISVGFTNNTLSLEGIGGSNTASITKTTLGLSYTDGADITSQNTSQNTANVGNQSVANAQDGIARARAGLDSSGNVQRTVDRVYGGFGTNVNTLFGSTVGRFPRWNGSSFAPVSDSDYANSQIDQTFIENVIDPSTFRSTIGAGTSNFDGNYNNLSNRPSLFDGNYNSLSNRPTIPTNTNQLTNGAGYITGITSANVTGALGFTPYNSTNPSGFTANGTTMNSSGNFASSSNIGSSKTLIDPANERILIQD